MIDLEELKKLALAATPGPWWIDSHGHAMVSHSEGEHSLALIFQADDRMGPAVRHESTGNLSHWRNDVDATYIAAANPAAILELIERLERAEHERGALQQTLASRSTCMGVGDGNGKLFVYGDYESIKAAQAMVLELERLRGFEQKLAKAEHRHEIAIRHANRRAEANKEMALTFSPPAKALSIFKTWWAMNEAEWELTGTVVSDSEIILHYSGSGASCHVTAGDIRKMVGTSAQSPRITEQDAREVVEYPSGTGELIVSSPDVNGVVIVRDESGEYRRVALSAIKKLDPAQPQINDGLCRSCRISAGYVRRDDGAHTAVTGTCDKCRETRPILDARHWVKTTEKPANCRNRLRDEGKPYPRSGCAHCKTGGLTGCPFERGEG